MPRIAINGMGRIGRTTLRQLMALGLNTEVVAVNDLIPLDNLVKLLKFDSVYGRLPYSIEQVDEGFILNGQTIHYTSEPDPSKLPWSKHDVDVVLDCTGLFKSYDKASGHLNAGAKKVVLSYPVGDDRIKSLVLGVNDDLLTADDRIVSNASCTTNCTAPVASILHKAFGIKKGMLSTIHAYTADQRVNDASHKDMRRARASAVNIIPTSTGAAKALGLIIPELAGKVGGSAYRVPVITGSCVDLVVETEKSCTVEEVNALMKAHAEGTMKGILDYSEDDLVSTDIIASPYSSIFDSQLTALQDGLLKVVSWYDNEFGYSTRMAELCARIGNL